MCRTSPRLIVAVLSLICFVAHANAQGEPNCYVLSVGIDRYESSPLHGCVNDAKFAVRDLIAQKGRRFNDVKSKTLLDEAATSQNIRTQLTRLEKVGKAGDVIVLFLSGHGAKRKTSWDFVSHDYLRSRRPINRSTTRHS